MKKTKKISIFTIVVIIVMVIVIKLSFNTRHEESYVGVTVKVIDEHGKPI